MKKKNVVIAAVAAVVSVGVLGAGFYFLAPASINPFKEEVDNVYSVSEVAYEQIQDSPLSSDEMFEVVVEFFDIYGEMFTYTGDDVIPETVLNDDGSVSVYVGNAEVDDEGMKTGNVVNLTEVFSWDTVEEAFAYIYGNGCVSLDGTLVFSREDLISEYETYDDTTDTSVAESEDVAVEDVVEDITEEPVTPAEELAEDAEIDEEMMIDSEPEPVETEE